MDFTPEDERLIKEKWEELLQSCTKICKNDEDWEFIKRAFFLAKEAHGGVRRRSGEPYLLHPIAVAKIVVDEIGLGVKSVVAALLHDVVEDTEYTVEDMEAHLRAQDRQDGRWAYEDVGRIQCRYFGAGGVFPQSPAHAFGRRAGDPDQNRRPPAQHAYAGVDAYQQADQNHG